MCQQYEHERAFMVAMDSFVSMKGWAAHRDGKPREYDNILHDEAFFHGYDCRATYFTDGKNHVVPWAITKEFRDRQEHATGRRCYDEPTLEQADEIVGHYD